MFIINRDEGKVQSLEINITEGASRRENLAKVFQNECSARLWEKVMGRDNFKNIDIGG